MYVGDDNTVGEYGKPRLTSSFMVKIDKGSNTIQVCDVHKVHDSIVKSRVDSCEKGEKVVFLN